MRSTCHSIPSPNAEGTAATVRRVWENAEVAAAAEVTVAKLVAFAFEAHDVAVAISPPSIILVDQIVPAGSQYRGRR